MPALANMHSLCCASALQLTFHINHVLLFIHLVLTSFYIPLANILWAFEAGLWFYRYAFILHMSNHSINHPSKAFLSLSLLVVSIRSSGVGTALA